ncbi:MAG: hypothetical protein LUH63_04445 [Parabacteroides sp.]|nr:hypothetical protein [Parabacteroides sp.]
MRDLFFSSALCGFPLCRCAGSFIMAKSSCHYFANDLSCLWQSFAMPVARLCHAVGKALPLGWQDCAIKVAKELASGENGKICL